MDHITESKLKIIPCKVFLMTILICSFIFCFQKNMHAQDNLINLKGKVIDKQTNTVISLVYIKLGTVNSKQYFETQTDVSGNYKFHKISSGAYQLNASHVGYKEFSEMIDIQKDDINTFNIFLEEIDIETEKINVTATKTETTLQQTPSSISIVNSEEIFGKNILTFDNVLEEVQGVTVHRSNGINVNSLSIRGSSDVAGGGIGNRVLLLLDGRPSLTGDSKGALWSLIPVSLIERTEIVKGAFSSLYGSSAIGGVINVITKKPAYKPSTSVNLNYGFYEKLSDSLRFTNKLLSFSGGDIVHSNTIKKFSYLINLNYLKNDGHAQQTNYNFYGITGKFTYDVLSNRDLEATIQYTNSHSGFPHYWKKDGGSIAEPFKVSSIYIGDKIEKQTQSYDLFYRAIPNTKSKYTTRFYYYNLKSNSFYNSNNPVSQQFAGEGQGLNTYINSYNFGNITQMDFQLGQSNYLLGGFDYQMNIVRSDPSDILYGNQQMNNFGVFAQDQMSILKDKNGKVILSSTAGLRLDYNKVVSGVNSFQLSPKLSFIYTPVALNKIFTNTSYRVLAGRAFRAPSIAEIYFKKELFGGFEFIYNPNLKPEEMLSFEIGLRKQYKNRFTLDLSLFFNDYDNLIQYVNIGNSLYGPFQVQNVARAQIKGFEFFIDYTSKLKLFRSSFEYYFNVGYSYLNARDLSQNRTNDYLPYKPAHNFNFTTNFKHSGFNLNINGRHLSKIDEVIFYKYEEPESYFLLNTKLSKDISGSISLFIAVNNFLNESYQELERIQAPNRNINSGINIKF